MSFTSAVSSGIITNGEVISGGTQTVYDGGTANSTTVRSGGYQVVSSGGTANSTHIESGGFLLISSGGTIANTLNDGRINIYSNGIAHSTTILSGAHVGLLSGGTMSIVVQNAGGAISTWTDATIISGTNTRSDGYHSFSIISGTASNFLFEHGGSLYVESGHSSINSLINDYGYLYVKSGGTATNTAINSGGALHISSGASVNIINQDNDGKIRTNTGANITSGVNKRSDGHSSFSIVDGVASNFLLFDNGTLDIYNGDSAYNTLINSGGTQTISSEGTAYDTEVNSSGLLILSSGSIASGVVQHSGGRIYANTDTTISNGINYRTDGHSSFSIINGVASNFIVNYPSFTVSSGHSAINTLVNNGSMHVHGSATGTIINFSGNLLVSNGGYANSTSVNSSGTMFVYSGSTATDTTINFGGTQYLYRYCTTSKTTVNYGGRLFVPNYAVANEIIINSGGISHIDRYASASNVIQNSGGATLAYTTSVITNGTNTRSDGHSSFSVINGIASNFLLENRGQLIIGSGHSAINTIIDSGGFLYVSSGGFASNVVQSTGGAIRARTGATILSGTNDRSDGYNMFSMSNGIANNFLLENAGYLDIEDGHIANNTIVNSSGHLEVGEFGAINSTTINSGGTVMLEGNTSASYTTINSGGSIWAYGNASHITQNSGGIIVTFTRANITNGVNERTDGNNHFSIINGVASNILLESGGSLSIEDITHSAINTIIESGGALRLESGGTASGTIVHSGGAMQTKSIAIVRGTNARTDGNNQFSLVNGIASNFLLENEGWLIIESGHSAINTLINYSGALEIKSGGTASNTTVNSGGSVWIGGTASDTVVNGGLMNTRGDTINTNIFSGGILSIYSNGDIKGNLTINGGIVKTASNIEMEFSDDQINLINNADMSDATLDLIGGGNVNVKGVNNNTGNLSIAGGGALNFDISAFSTVNNNVMVTDLTSITTSNIHITIDSALNLFGNYKLAGNASLFDGLITIFDDTIELGNLSLANPVIWGDFEYSLSIESNELQFNINIDDSQAPSIPAGLVGVFSNATNSLDWNDATDDKAGVKEYIVEYSDNSGFTGSASQTVVNSKLEITGLGFGKYFWRIKAVDNTNNESLWSNVISAYIDTVSNDFSSASEIDVADVYTNSEYVGLGDACDMYCFDVATPGEFDFALTGLDAKAMLGLYVFDGAKYKRIKNASARTDKVSGEISALLDDVLLDTGTYYVEVVSGDKGAGRYNTEYTLEIDSDYFPEATLDEFNFKSRFGTPTELTLDVNADATVSDWVGFGDAQDVYKFDVNSAGEFDFALTGLDSKAMLCLYKFDGAKYKKVKNASAKLNKITGETAASFDNILLNTGTYYLEVLSGDKGKGKCNTAYDLSIDGTTFPDATDNNSWQDATAIAPDTSLAGFVGFGDAYDYYQFEVSNLGAYDFNLSGNDKNAKLTVYQWDYAKEKLKKRASTSLKYGEANINNFSLDAGLYYVEVLSKDKGKGKYNTEYDLDITSL
jgi:autotransporter passenger strand-loop-strand repeat protein